jgi:hypothetical protein
MIELYRPPDCPECADIEAALKEMVVAHKVTMVRTNERPEALPADVALPALKDNGQVISGQAAIVTHLRALEKFVADWRRFQGDACYIDDQGETC